MMLGMPVSRMLSRGKRLFVQASIGRWRHTPQSSRRPVVSAPSRTNGTPLVHARGRRHTPQREACRLGFDCVINVTILAKGKTIYQLVLRITQWGEKRKGRETRRSQNP